MGGRRIFMIGWEYPPQMTGGLGVACRGLARGLVRRGFEVDFFLPRLEGGELDDQGVRVFSPHAEHLTTEEIAEFQREIAVLAEAGKISAYDAPDFGAGASAAEFLKRVVEGRTLTHFLRGGYGDHIYSEIYSFAALARLYIRRKAYDLIHAHDWMTFPAALAAAHATRLPLVCHIHATEFDRSGENVNQFIYDLERHAVHDCTLAVTVSNYTRSLLVRRYGAAEDRVFPVHNAVEFELNETERPAEARGVRDPVVLFLGRITFQKGPEYFVRAARKVIEQFGKVRFVMVGVGDMYSRMIELAADLGVGKHFHYTGFLNREQVRRIYGLSDLYVMPSVSEPFGISPLEAMLYGVPVIVSKQSGVSEIIQHAIKVDFWDVDELANSIIEVLRNRDARERLREDGRHEAELITWDHSAKRLEEIFERAIAIKDKAASG